MYPKLEIDTQLVYNNARILRRLCLEKGIEPTAVIKGFNGIDYITEAIVRAGYRCIASSRIPHLKAVKDRGYEVETLALRIPMLSEVEELVAYCDISLNSEPQTLRAIDAESARQGKVHKVILMRDLGDLREGLIDRARFYEVAIMIEQELPHVMLYGVGANLTCYGSVIPTTKNLSELVKDAFEVEQRISRKLDVVSGGSTSSLPLLIKGGMPQGVNNLRIGEALVVPCDLLDYWQCDVPGLSNATMTLKTEIIEIGEKPTKPIGKQGVNGMGTKREYENKGIRRRALLAIGVFDVGDYEKLIPVDPGVTLLGGSSDHLIADIQESKQAYMLGDTVAFELRYKSMLFATGNPLIKKVRVR